MTTQPIDTAAIDRNVTRTIGVLLELRQETLNELILATGINKSTMIRRRRAGGWSAAEVAVVADHFGVEPQRFYDGPESLMREGFRLSRGPSTAGYVPSAGAAA